MATLSVQHVVLNAGNKLLLNDVSFNLQAGQVMALIGPNGAGKTSLMHAISGAVALQAGNVQWAGKDMLLYPPKARARSVAVLPQYNPLDFDYTVEEVVSLGRIPHMSGQVVDNAVVKQALEAMDVASFATQLYTRLSGGEKQRVQLARVMAQIWRQQDAPQRLLLLDEPCAGLDIAHQQQLMQAVRRFAAQGVAIIMVLHDFNLAARYADILLALREGKRIAFGSPQQVLTEANMQHIFNVNCRIMQHPDDATPLVLFNEK